MRIVWEKEGDKWLLAALDDEGFIQACWGGIALDRDPSTDIYARCLEQEMDDFLSGRPAGVKEREND